MRGSVARIFLIILSFIISSLIVDAVFASGFLLKLPYQKTENLVVTRGYSTPPTHKVGTKDQYALDFTQNGCEAYGKSVVTVADGVVDKVNDFAKNYSDYGNYVIINHGNGFVTRYAHLQSFVVVVGQSIKQGELIGYIGNTGNVSGIACPQYPGVHLHFAMYQKQTDGKLVAYKPEPMSGYENFVAGKWYTSDNELSQKKFVGVNQPGNVPWWQKFLGAIGGFFDEVTQPIVHFVAQTTVNNQLPYTNNQLPIWQAEIVSKSSNLNLKKGELAIFLVKVKNIGNQAWQPSNQVSVNVYNKEARDIYYSSWRTRLRPVVSNLVVAPGQAADFSFQIQAPLNTGNYLPSFQIVYTLNNSSFETLKSDLISWQIVVSEEEKKEQINKDQSLQIIEPNLSEDPIIQPPSQDNQNDQGDSSGGGSWNGGGGGTGGGGNEEKQSDQIPPETTLIADNLLLITNNQNIIFEFSADESSTFECKLDSQSFHSCVSPKNYDNLVEGSHNFQVKAIDLAGNSDLTPAQFSWIIDLSGPVINVTSQPSSPTNQINAQFKFSSDEQAIFECSFDDSNWEICVSSQNYENLSDGAHLFSLRAKDEVGNYSQPIDVAWIVDTTNPISSITTHGFFNLVSWPGLIDGSFDADDLSKVEIYVRKESTLQYLGYVSSTLAWVDESSWLEANLSGADWTFALSTSLLSDDNYKIWSRAQDDSNNLQENFGESSFIFDVTAPDKINDPDLLKENSELIFSWSEVVDNLSGLDYYEVAWWNGSDPETYVQTDQLIFSINNFDEGKFYYFKVRGVDLAGNQAEWSETLSFQPTSFLENWKKRKIITIDNSQNNNELTNFEVNVPISYQTEMNNDFSDIRFTDEDGQTLLNYGWEINDDGSEKKENGVSAEVVVKIPLIISQQQKKIYLYYGNISAPAVANLENTLTWFDHFKTVRNNEYDYKTVDWQIAESRIKLSTESYQCGYLMPKNLEIKNLWLKARMSRGKGWEAETRIFWRYSNDNNTWQASGNPYLNSNWGFFINGIWTNINNGQIWDQSYAVWEIKSYGTNHSINIGDILSGSISNNNFNQAGKIRIYDWWRTNGLPRQSGMYTYVDYLYVRQYADPTPVVSFK